jgi:hypothetical protein
MRSHPVLYFRKTAEFHYGDMNGATIRVVRFGDPGTTAVPFVGDWDGSGTDKPILHFGWYPSDPGPSEFHLGDLQGNTVKVVRFGDKGIGLSEFGDWDGTGVDRPIIYVRATAEFHLGDLQGNTVKVIPFGDGAIGWKPHFGDWDGTGTDKPVLFHWDKSEFHFGDLQGNTVKVVRFGDPPPYPGKRPEAFVGDGVFGLFFPSKSEFHFGDLSGNTVRVVRFGDPGPDVGNPMGYV